MMRFSQRRTGRFPACGIPILTLLLYFVPAAAHPQEGATVTGTITDSRESRPLSGAIILVIETQRSTITNASGSYELAVPAGEYTLLATKTGYEVTETRVTLQSGGAQEVNFALAPVLSQFGEELVVIGSRSQRTAVETPVPVDVLTNDEIVQTGMTETSRVIQFLAPSFNFSTSTISDGTDVVRPSTLRGLGPDQTLVLVNGKRRHTSALVHVNGSIGRGTAGVDLNAIPPSAIERIEVLRDGAAAQYGSDAIAGVINVVLKSQTNSTQVNLSAGQHYEGDGEVAQASVNHGWSIAQTGFFNLTAEYRDRGFTNRAGLDPRDIFLPLADGSPNPREATYDRLNHRYGDAESQNAYLFLNSSVPLGPGSELYFFGGFSDRDGESAGFNRLPSQGRTNIFIHPAGHLPLINTKVDDTSVSLGVRKTFSSWALDASVTTGENQFQFVITNSANTSLGPQSPDRADAGTLSFGQTTVGLDLFGTVDWGLKLPVNVALGAEFREDRYEITAGEDASWIDGGFPNQFGGRSPAGIQVFPGFRPANEVDESRDNVALYGDLEFSLTDKFLLGLAARFEDYSDFGSTLDGKIALRYAFTDQFALRASTSTGFRAPSLHQASFNNTSTQFVLVGDELQPLEVGTFRQGSVVTNAFDVPALKEETSNSFSVGFTARPRPNLSVTADIFHIDIEDRIVISGLFRATNPQIAPILEPLGVNAAQFFTNAIDTETEGADLVVAYTRPVGQRRTLSLTGAANWNDTQVVGNVSTPSSLVGLGESTLFDRRERSFVERGQPREAYNLSGRYRHGPFAALLRFNKFGAVVTVEAPTNPDIDQTFSSQWLTDLDLSYKLPNGIRIAVGGNNIFDVFPDENRPEISFNGIFVYPRRTAPFGFNGGYYYTRISFDF